MKYITGFIISIFFCINCFAEEECDKTNEIDIVASTIYHECRGESYEGKMAVASVIYNRSKQERWKDLGLSGVCLQKYQFSCHNNGYNEAIPTNTLDRISLKECRSIAASMVNGWFTPIIDSNHYCAIWCNVDWKHQLRNVVIVGNHIFGTL